ncbi:transcriptional regulator NadR [Cellulomonas chitinilytica]|uniref:Transcriptional regulator NadR n=1 Tax=Cellulomonas chitinilytica TaxID=398759 RepID=A0A919P1C2_9CELL|nr:AAA family ATPase [Cellulomonas chitinilytica]GIG20430.1 transcriptional regulator NadR [Cellulomonas chitinilytica]
MSERAWVLMTALPPTTGHEDLIRFATRCARTVQLVLCTQPSEPLAHERDAALRAFAARAEFGGAIRVHRVHQELPQEPADAPDFWDLWSGMLRDLGARPGDLVVASEPYGAELASAIDGRFLPYDPDRTINPVKATRVREKPIESFAHLLAEFQPFLRKRVTLFGAESVGKTTMTNRLDELGLAAGFPEWARPYLELDVVGHEVTAEKMRAIWQGQLAQQLAAEAIATRRGRAFVAQDTDLFSTVGYWLLKGAEFGEPDVPPALWADAARNASDLYIVLGQDAVPFAADPLRYGGDRRESDDAFWTDLCESAGLHWVLVDEADPASREERVVAELRGLFGDPLAYQRRGAEYRTAGRDR